MKVVFWIKSEKGVLQHEESSSFEEEEFTKLKSDLDKYSQGSDPIKGSWYKCKLQRIDIIIFLKFEEIVFIRAYAEQ